MPRIWDEEELRRRAEEEEGIPAEREGHPRGKTQTPDADRAGRWTIPADRFFWAVLLLALLLSVPALVRRAGVEWTHRSVAIVVEYRDVLSLAREAGLEPDAVYRELAERGVVGITAPELTGKDLSGGALPLTYGSLASLGPTYYAGLSVPLDRGTLLIDNKSELFRLVEEYLSLRMPKSAKRTMGNQTLIVLPAPVDELADAGLLPDFAALDFARGVSAQTLYRPYPAVGLDGEAVARGIRWLKERYPFIASIVPAGQIVAGYPNLSPTAEVLKEKGITVAQAEFVRQIGASQLYSAMVPDLLPLHSLVREELISRRMSRGQIVERMVRAVHERSIRLILLRPYELYSVGRYEPFKEDTEAIRDALRSRGYGIGWPQPIPLFRANLFSAWALSAVFLLCVFSYLLRYFGRRDEGVAREACVVFLVGVFLLGFAAWKISSVSRLLGGFSAAFVAAEATIFALDRYRKPLRGLLAGLGIVVAGGLTIAAFYGTTVAMLRLSPFSGVKLTLLLPPLLVLAYDLKRRVHPESLAAIVQRPPLWGELFLLGILMLGALLLTVRSGNVSFVPGWEVRFRDMLERLLWVRPRTKEFLVGYPCLVLYYAFVRRDWAARYREVLRVGASLAFASAANTFCHFHTLLPLTVVRVVNGWWLGIVVGLLALLALDYIGRPLWRIGGKELFD